jgi:DNA-binding MarR family transcriptional regulator
VTDEYRALAEFRYQIRKFLHFSEEAARECGLEPQHHQLLLAIKGLPEGRKATIREIAERLQLQHHSTVELINRLSERGAVERHRSEEDRREVLIRLTRLGESLLRKLSIAHQQELETAGPDLSKSLSAIMRANRRKRSAA